MGPNFSFVLEKCLSGSGYFVAEIRGLWLKVIRGIDIKTMGLGVNTGYWWGCGAPNIIRYLMCLI